MLDDFSRSAASAHATPAQPGDPVAGLPAAGPDPLTRILLNLRLDGVEYGRCLMHEPWAIGFAAQPAARFHFVATGGAWLHTPQGGWLALKAGDAVLLPRGTGHTLASSPGVPPVPLAAFERERVADNIYLLRHERPGTSAARREPSSVMFCGSMTFNLDAEHPLLAMMPEVIRAGDLAQRDPGVPMLLEAMEREAAQNRIGACGILARMADVLAASIIRAWVECACSVTIGGQEGWIAALRSPGVGKVLAAIHAAPEQDWSVPALASIMGASRSRFAQAFKESVGESPARYVARVRMSQARRWIADDGMRVTVAADRLGYDSEASFSRAFKRVIGHAPSKARA